MNNHIKQLMEMFSATVEHDTIQGKALVKEIAFELSKGKTVNIVYNNRWVEISLQNGQVVVKDCEEHG